MQQSWTEGAEMSPSIILTAEVEIDQFDSAIIQDWKAEGFDVTYLPLSQTNTQQDCIGALQRISNSLGPGEKYAIIAFGKAASVILSTAMKPMHKLCALIAYYPDAFPATSGKFPPSLHVLVHFAGSPFPALECRQYVYPEVQNEFAEANREAYEKVATGAAWSRTLAILRKAFEIEVDLKKIWEDHVELEFVTKDADVTMATMIAEPYVNHIPTMTGGIGYKDLHRFYRDYFIPGNPPSLKMKLLSRTVGTDRVVDEMHLSFKHTQVMPWLLPDVEPTNKDVEVALVVIACIRGGKLYHEHIYWDQASVLVQIGLLDPTVVPGRTSAGRLPVVDGAGARKVMDESRVRSNEFISSW